MDHRDELRRAQEELSRTLAAIPDSALDDPTPCEGWAVRDLLRHVHSVNLSDLAQFTGETFDPDTDPRLDGDHRTAYPATSAEVTAVLSDDSILERTIEFAGGTHPASVGVAFHFLDSFIHIWDLRRALGLPVELDADLVEAGLGVAALIPDSPDVRGANKAFAAKVEVPADASAQDRLIGLVGRSPDWKP